MGSDPLLLVFDTSAAHCAAAVFEGGTMRAEAFVPMARGQGEALVPLLQAVMAEAGCDLGALSALGVGVGPGNFTGTRIAVATARGLALSLGCPAIGVSTFDLMREIRGSGTARAEIVSLQAPRGNAYVRSYRNDVPVAAPRLIDPAAPPDDLRGPGDLTVTGYRAAQIAHAFEAGHREVEITDIPWRLGIVTERMWRIGEAPTTRPAPLYVRPPDAAPPADPPPAILP